MPLKKTKIAHGDTIMEVMFAVSVFATVALITMNMMNSGLNSAQRTLEITMARTAMNSQSNAITFIHNSYISELGADDSGSAITSRYGKIWKEIVKHSIDPDSFNDPAFDINSSDSCAEAIDNQRGMSLVEDTGKNSIFAVNSRALIPTLYADGNTDNTIEKYLDKDDNEILAMAIVDGNVKKDGVGGDGIHIIRPAPLYPRITYNEITGENIEEDDMLRTSENSIFIEPNTVEGIFDSVVKAANNHSYDFYIRTCWDAPGSTTYSTMTTVVRLYDPESI